MSDWYVLRDKKAVRVGSLEEWAKEHGAMRHVADDTVGDVRISTVFLGLDHSHGFGPPLLFETMIFGGVHNDHQARCSTWEQAEAQHAEALAMVKSRLH